MRQLTRGIPILAALLVLPLAADPASAAKGIKKNGQHLAQGTVTAVHRFKNGETLTILTHHPKRKKGLPRTAGTTALPQTFTVDRRTRITGGALQHGKRVSVAASGQHADTIAVVHSTRTARRRTPTYHRRANQRTVIVRNNTPRTTVRVSSSTRVTNLKVQQRVNVHRPAVVQHHTNPPHPHVAKPPHPAHRAATPARRKK
jgi:hypothetical protein